MAAGRSFVKTVLGGSVDGLLPVILCFIMMENNIIYNLTVSGSVISRYVELRYTKITHIFSVLRANFGTFSDITLVFVAITFPLTANI